MSQSVEFLGTRIWKRCENFNGNPGENNPEVGTSASNNFASRQSGHLVLASLFLEFSAKFNLCKMLLLPERRASDSFVLDSG